MRRFLFWTAFAVALAMRLALLDLRPLHHDEGVNAWLASRPLEGAGVFYNPDNFHGPFLFFLVLPFMALLGQSDLVLRLPAALPLAVAVERYLLDHGYLQNGSSGFDVERTDYGWVIHVSGPFGHLDILVHAPGPTFPVPTDTVPRVLTSIQVFRYDISNGF